MHKASKVTYQEGNIILNQGEPCLCLCVILKGQVSHALCVCMSLLKVSPDCFFLFSTHVWFVNNNKHQVRIVRKVNTASIYGDAPSNGALQGTLTITVATLSSGSVFGDDFLLRKGKYACTTICAETGTEILFLTKKDVNDGFDGPSRDMILSVNRDLHQDDICLILSHESKIREKLVTHHDSSSNDKDKDKDKGHASGAAPSTPHSPYHLSDAVTIQKWYQ